MNADVRAGRVLVLKNFITEEDRSSQIDGIKTEFTLLNDFSSGTVKVYLNGLRQQKGAGKDYIEVSPDKIDFDIKLDIDDILLVDYIKK